MVNRIRELLQARQLSPTQFADLIGVGRPVVSHILSGRNKPSLEVVQKIIGAFPGVSLPWLLSGVGEMLGAPTQASSLGAGADAISTQNNDSEKVRPTRRAPAGPARGPRVAPAAPPAASPRAVGAPAGGAEPVTNALGGASEPAGGSLPQPPPPPPAVPARVTPAAAPPLLPLGDPGKAIRRIVIFYRDGSFADYQPEA